MHLYILAALLLALPAWSQDDFQPSQPAWQYALRNHAPALEAAGELETLLSESDLAGLARHFPRTRLRMLLLEEGVGGGLYGPDQARALLGIWMRPLATRELRISMVDLSEDARRLNMIFQWRPATPEDQQPPRQLVCEVLLFDDGWVFEEVLAP